MKYATLTEEKKLWKKGYKCVVGLDEAGRGPLAGPVVAAAVMIKNPKPKAQNPKLQLKIKKLKDSKQLTAKQREYFYKILTRHPQISYGVGIVSEKIIDKINILEATKLAMKKAVKGLKADFLILDGKMKLNLPILQKSIVKGDEKVFSCAAASIVAKVTRDRIMLKYHEKFPQYRFDLHKGYPTELHLRMLKKYGQCAIQRKSFNYYAP